MQEELGAAMAGDQRLGAMFMNMMPVDVTEPADVADTVLFLASDVLTTRFLPGSGRAGNA